MIVVKIEMWPGGNEAKKYDLGRMTLANITGEAKHTEHAGKIGDYDAQVLSKPKYRRFTRRAKIENHRRLDKPVWNLIAKALVAMGYASM